MSARENYKRNAEKAKERGLQKFTDSEFLNNLLIQSKVGNDNLERLTPHQLILFDKFFTDAYNNANGERKDELLEMVIDKLPEKTRNQIWEINHLNIMNAILDYVDACGGMPTKSKIADYTGLSRQTVDKHFKEFQVNPLYKGIDEQFKFMVPKVMGEVLRQSIRGNMRAAKLFLDFTSGAKTKTQVNTQNNYIQINGAVFNEDKLNKLKPEQLRTIETVLRSLDSETES